MLTTVCCVLGCVYAGLCLYVLLLVRTNLKREDGRMRELVGEVRALRAQMAGGSALVSASINGVAASVSEQKAALTVSETRPIVRVPPEEDPEAGAPTHIFERTLISQR